jgi:hypothetical protein
VVLAFGSASVVVRVAAGLVGGLAPTGLPAETRTAVLDVGVDDPAD